jgi:hypothetical protein
MKVCVSYMIQEQNQNAAWLNPKKPKAHTLRRQKSWVKTMLIALFDAKDTICYVLVPEQRAVNVKFMKR